MLLCVVYFSGVSEAVSTSETSVNFSYTTHHPKKIVIFILAAART
jgi:hypothetical protein